MRSPIALLALPLIAACAGSPAPSAPSVPSSADVRPSAPSEGVRLYALDCGRIEINDWGFFSETGKPIGKPATLADPCFLIHHPKGTLLWDTGLTESIGTTGEANPIGKQFVDRSIREQLAALSLAPKDITFLGLSHFHADHSGNANLFTSSTWLLDKKELDAATATPAPLGVVPATFSEYRNVKKKLLEGEEDVFGDGSVRIVPTPGHTAGHRVLVVKLAHAGTVVLSGDLSHSRENWEKSIVPSFNYNREETAASLARTHAFVTNEHARFVVQHSAEDFHSLPKFPSYLD